MGPRGKNAVVDHRLRVHGVGRLRVMDASVMPRLVGANTNAACVMIGEKGAAMLLEDLREESGDTKADKWAKTGKKKKKKATKAAKEEL